MVKETFYILPSESAKLTPTGHILYPLSHQNRLSFLQYKQKLVEGVTRLSIATKTNAVCIHDEARQLGRPAATLPRFVGSKNLIKYRQKQDLPLLQQGNWSEKESISFEVAAPLSLSCPQMIT
ncbi:hypothetical protein PoB_001494300 [Plakobranchus ocellatus]|uniref:Uncharacterized protein n=1 Tax=Plakobranchus ocellatus TaxID=259542 RepID=A0AAV3Z1F5_9GAST|nr:hypothetical protein PoB_001494300 [Plakobranchus ocellatus]